MIFGPSGNSSDRDQAARATRRQMREPHAVGLCVVVEVEPELTAIERRRSRMTMRREFAEEGVRAHRHGRGLAERPFRFGLPLPVCRRLVAPAWIVRADSLAHDSRRAAVRNRIMSIPISARLTCADTGPIRVIRAACSPLTKAAAPIIADPVSTMAPGPGMVSIANDSSMRRLTASMCVEGTSIWLSSSLPARRDDHRIGRSTPR